MSGLTPSERRGACVLALVLAIGTVTDLYHARFPGRVPETRRFPGASVSADSSAPAAAAAPARQTAAASRPRPLDLDSAGVSELDALPGIGPVLAARIVEHRRLHGRFHHVDELLLVPGIGPRLLERLRPWLREPTH